MGKLNSEEFPAQDRQVVGLCQDVGYKCVGRRCLLEHGPTQENGFAQE